MSKPLMSDTEIKRRKKLQAHLSVVGGTLGLGALASRGGATLAGGGKLARLVRVPKSSPVLATKLKDLSTGLTTTGAGIGGAGAYNFAAYTRAESRKRVQKDVGGVMDFGLSGVTSGSAAHYEEVSKDWMNITEHQRRAADSRRTTRRGKDMAGLGGTGIGLAATIGRSNGANVGQQTSHFARSMKDIGTKAKYSRSLHGAGKLTKIAAQKNPYGAAVTGGAALMAGGFGTAVAGGMNARRHNVAIARQRKARIGKAWSEEEILKAFDPERSRRKRMQHYSTAAGIGSGAAFTGAAFKGKKAFGTAPRPTSSVPSGKKLGGGVIRNVGTGLRSDNGRLVRMGLKDAGKAGGLGLAGVGLAVGSERLRSYGKNHGKHR